MGERENQRMSQRELERERETLGERGGQHNAHSTREREGERVSGKEREIEGQWDVRQQTWVKSCAEKKHKEDTAKALHLHLQCS
jgi:hypothetical protein